MLYSCNHQTVSAVWIVLICLFPEWGSANPRSLRPPCHAVTLDSPAIIKLLCNEGADLCLKPSPIHYALDREGDRRETAAYKAARNDDVNKLELLHLACENSDLQVSWHEACEAQRDQQVTASIIRVSTVYQSTSEFHEHCLQYILHTFGLCIVSIRKYAVRNNHRSSN